MGYYQQLNLFENVSDKSLIERLTETAQNYFNRIHIDGIEFHKTGEMEYKIWSHVPKLGIRYSYCVGFECYKGDHFDYYKQTEEACTPLLETLREMAEPEGMEIDIYTGNVISIFGMWKDHRKK